MPDLIPFHFDTHDIQVHVDDSGNPWWVLHEICAVLGLSNPSRAASRLKPTESTTLTFGESGLIHKMLLVSEQGLYRLIMRSNKEEAERFQDWVFREVLPQIRKTGSYTVSAAPPDPVEHYPELRAIRALLIATAEARDEAALARQEAQAAEVRAVRAETKADLALEDAHRMTVEEFVLKNGLLHQFPPTTWPSIATWLKRFCDDYGMKIEKQPTPGKYWRDENNYLIRALGRWLDYETRRPKQIRLVQPDADGNSTVREAGVGYARGRRVR